MSSRRSGKIGRSLVDGSASLTMEEAGDLTYSDYAMLDEADRNRIFRHPVHPDDLKIDPAIQVRIKPNPARVEELKQVLLNGGHFKDPIRAFRDDEGNLWLSAGFRRTDATRQALLEAPSGLEIAPLICEDCPGGRAAAIEDAENDNLKHGEPLSTEEKRGIFERRYQRGHEWFADNWSNNQIAAELAVSESTIRRWRSPLTSPNDEVRENEGGKQPQKRTVQRGGETYQMKTSKIGQTAQKRTKRQPSTPAPEPVRNLDESEPAGQWQDRPAQPRGLYQETAGNGWSAKMSADQIRLSVEIEPDEDEPANPAQIKRAILEHLRAAAAGLRNLGLQDDADNLLEYIYERREEWNL